MNHTPTPWEQGGLPGRRTLSVWTDDEMHKVCTTEKEKDAAFIVKAANNHDSLLKAANQALEALDIYPARTNGFAPRQSKIRAAAKRKLRDAIALSEGEEG